jgi:WD40 repeat protein
VVWRAPAHAHWVTCVAVGDGGAVASGSTDGVARAWADGVNVGTYPIHGETVYGTAWVGAAGFASCSFDGRVALNAPTGGGAAARGRH